MRTHELPYPSTPDDDYVASIERARMTDLLDEVGPGAATLCAGWDAHHLAAHLVVRESDPLGLVMVFSSERGDARVDRRVRSQDFTSLVEQLRAGPPRLSPFGPHATDRLLNGVEFFVHHEDVRRAVPGFTRRELPRWAEDELWSRLGLLARARLRKAPVGVALRRADSGELVVVARRSGTVVVRGLPSELALYVNGRTAVADVSFDGADADIAALTSFS